MYNATGSSPHAWGKCLKNRERLESLRFIPTCVGQIYVLALAVEKSVRFIPTCVGQIELQEIVRFHCLRFIPTCVGQIFHCLFML